MPDLISFPFSTALMMSRRRSKPCLRQVLFLGLACHGLALCAEPWRPSPRKRIHFHGHMMGPVFSFTVGPIIDHEKWRTCRRKGKVMRPIFLVARENQEYWGLIHFLYLDSYSGHIIFSFLCVQNICPDPGQVYFFSYGRSLWGQ